MSPDGLQERLDAEDLDHPFDVVGEHIEAHLGADPLFRPSKEVGRTHP